MEGTQDGRSSDGLWSTIRLWIRLWLSTLTLAFQTLNLFRFLISCISSHNIPKSKCWTSKIYFIVQGHSHQIAWLRKVDPDSCKLTNEGGLMPEFLLSERRILMQKIAKMKLLFVLSLLCWPCSSHVIVFLSKSQFGCSLTDTFVFINSWKSIFTVAS